jgi:cell fate (sporulation/competence/biofilm development) regulator YlbF (YheA/YmcA/DUF963 family)
MLFFRVVGLERDIFIRKELRMLLAAKKSPVLEKTEELCQTLLEQESYKELRGKMDAFAGDGEAQRLYESLCDKQDLLQGKQQRGLTLTDEEIDAFEKERDALFAHPVAAGFIEAQQQIQKLKDTISRYVAKTIDLGRLPEEHELRSGGCCGGGGGGGGCGCSH